MGGHNLAAPLCWGHTARAEELGFALSAWQALHRDCQPFVADEPA
jgi:hypothetical protein